MKTNEKLPLFYYPTEIVFVDDDDDFLASIKMILSRKYSIRTFSNPREALNYINQKPYPKHLIEPISVKEDRQRIKNNAGHWIKKALSASTIDEDVVDDSIEVSVIVVDYRMRDLDGLTLCESVSNPYIKKILLTGVIPTNEAIEAFNRGLIQQFVGKSDSDMLGKLERALLKMQHAHFTEISNSIKTHAVGGWMPAFADIKLLEYFQFLCNSLSVIEYYYHSNPTRFILVSKSGSKNMLLLYTEDELDTHVEKIKAGRFDQELVNAIASRKFIPWFHTPDGFYNDKLQGQCPSLYVAHKVEGDSIYYCAVIPDLGSLATDSAVLKAVKTFH